MTDIEILLHLIRSAVLGEDTDLSAISLSNGQAENIIRIASRHDLAHLIDLGIKKTSLPIDKKHLKALEKVFLQAALKVTVIDFELEKICSIFEKSGIDNIPLKGAVIRDMYPEKWMRTSCDIDILVRDKDIKLASKALIEAGYEYIAEKYHDIGFKTPSGITLELHFSICEHEKLADKILIKAFEYAVPICDNSHRFVFSDDFMMFYTVVHTAHHFHSGGCGIRPITDLVILKDRLTLTDEFYNLLKEAGLTKFYEGICALSRVWFFDEKHTALTEQMEDFIVEGGVYGTRKNHIVVEKSEAENRLLYFMSRIFPSLSEMRVRYRILYKAPFLLPVFWFVRIFKNGLFSKNRRRHIAEIGVVYSTPKSDQRAVGDMLESLGIKR